METWKEGIIAKQSNSAEAKQIMKNNEPKTKIVFLKFEIRETDECKKKNQKHQPEPRIQWCTGEEFLVIPHPPRRTLPGQRLTVDEELSKETICTILFWYSDVL